MISQKCYDALQESVKFLETLVDKNFKIDTFGCSDKPEVTCNTAACGLGWIAIAGYFPYHWDFYNGVYHLNPRYEEFFDIEEPDNNKALTNIFFNFDNNTIPILIASIYRVLEKEKR